MWTCHGHLFRWIINYTVCKYIWIIDLYFSGYLWKTRKGMTIKVQWEFFDFFSSLLTLKTVACYFWFFFSSELPYQSSVNQFSSKISQSSQREQRVWNCGFWTSLVIRITWEALRTYPSLGPSPRSSASVVLSPWNWKERKKKKERERMRGREKEKKEGKEARKEGEKERKKMNSPGIVTRQVWGPLVQNRAHSSQGCLGDNQIEPFYFSDGETDTPITL